MSKFNALRSEFVLDGSKNKYCINNRYTGFYFQWSTCDTEYGESRCLKVMSENGILYGNFFCMADCAEKIHSLMGLV